jgi:hypothetical protein
MTHQATKTRSRQARIVAWRVISKQILLRPLRSFLDTRRHLAFKLMASCFPEQMNRPNENVSSKAELLRTRRSGKFKTGITTIVTWKQVYDLKTLFLLPQTNAAFAAASTVAPKIPPHSRLTWPDVLCVLHTWEAP